ncbi:MAG: hypothetical protein U5N53_18465 [Mycobacterium sp.]|nr:hypothetical protein [Mycobacterium sp.]
MHTDARISDGDEFRNARAEAYQFRKGDWAEKPDLTSKILLTGDWNPCTTAEAEHLTGSHSTESGDGHGRTVSSARTSNQSNA